VPERSYQRLDAQPVKETVDRLQARIAARFPDRNLRLVADELSSAVEELLIGPQTRWYGLLRIASRILMALLAAVLVVGVVLLFRQSPDLGAGPA